MRRYVWGALAVLLACSLSVWRLGAQAAETLSGVKRVAVDWPGTEKGSTAVRDRLVQKLKAGGVEIVPQAAQADAVLHGAATIWVSGYVSPSPKSRSAQEAIYRGYASAEVTGKDGKVLWSYLVTPRPVGWRGITDDLADQLVHEFVEASRSRSAGETTGSAPPGGNGGSAITGLTGAGATFPAPMYQKWFEGFAHARPEIQIQYAAVGSEEGIQKVLAGQTDFGATDMPLSEQQLKIANRRMLQVATMLGAVVPIYNVKGAPDELNLTPEVLAGIFLGKIKRWNAPEIHAINKHAHLPDEEIAVIHRSDGSGTTFVWTEYLSKVSAEWKADEGAGTTVNWPVGKGAEQNEGVALAVRNTPNSIGYVEFIYALQHELDFASVRNTSGEFVKADLDSVTAAAKTAAIPENGAFELSITNAGGKHVYPIATFTWLLVPVESRDTGKTAAMRDLIRWVLTNGQKQCEGLGYAPLPAEFANRELQAVAALK
jgi:phosphate ABC transporter phosphate-binding protein